jgi:K(+)-stimulated pyrophosphate-energized sodium pump
MTLNIDMGHAPLFTGALLGATLIYLFSSFAMKAVRRAAETVVEEVRRQFRANAFIVQGTADPDYGICTDFVTMSALKTSVVPGLLAVVSPVAVGLIFRLFAGPNDAFPAGGNSVAAFLIVGTVCGTLLATAMNYGGGAWDSAKKFIDIGAYRGNGSGAHKAGVVGDIVANPFKGTTAPALEVLIKLLITIALVAAPLFI